jgi:hypothetical protein
VCVCMYVCRMTGRSRFDPRQRQKDFFSSHFIQTSSGAQPATCTMGTGVLSPGLERSWGAMLTTHPHLVLRSRMSRSYTSCPSSTFVACSGTALAFSIYVYIYVCVCVCVHVHSCVCTCMYMHIRMHTHMHVCNG